MPFRGKRTSDHIDLFDIPPSQRERLACIDFYLMFLGEISRKVIVEHFAVTSSMAVRDLATYRDLRPQNITYDGKRRRHLRLASFEPLFNYDISEVLNAFKVIKTKEDRLLSCEIPGRSPTVQTPLVSTICRGIHRQQPLKVHYLSLSRGEADRIIIPHTLVDNGTRWHVRAFDRSSGEFRDFVLNRFIKATLLSEPIDFATESLEADQQWQQFIELVLVPHPKLEHPESMMLDYDMKNGRLVMTTRAALAGYLLRRWRVDCSKNQQLNPKEYQLWLANREALAGVKSLQIASGYWLI